MSARRSAAVFVGAAAIAALLDCAAFGTANTDNKEPVIEPGPLAEASAPADVEPMSVVDAPPAACVPAVITDQFQRDKPGGGPIGWDLVETNGGTMTVRAPDGAPRPLEANTPGNTTGTPKLRAAYLEADLPSAPKRLRCRFRFRPISSFESGTYSYADVFQVVLRYPDKVVRLRLGFDRKGQLRVRDDHYAVEGDETTCQPPTCPQAVAPASTTPSVVFEAGAFEDVAFETDFDQVTVTKGDTVVIDDRFGLQRPLSVAIDLGIANFMDTKQSAQYTDLVCESDC